MEHSLKTHPAPFQATWDGDKPFECRRDDRGGYYPGDGVYLREYDPETEESTGRWMYARVGYVARGSFGIPPGYAVLGLVDIERNEGP